MEENWKIRGMKGGAIRSITPPKNIPPNDVSSMYDTSKDGWFGSFTDTDARPPHFGTPSRGLG